MNSDELIREVDFAMKELEDEGRPIQYAHVTTEEYEDEFIQGLIPRANRRFIREGYVGTYMGIPVIVSDDADLVSDRVDEIRMIVYKKGRCVSPTEVGESLYERD